MGALFVWSADDDGHMFSLNAEKFRRSQGSTY